jgi:hypothetical protein
MSIGIAQKAPTVNSEKKKARLRGQHDHGQVVHHQHGNHEHGRDQEADDDEIARAFVRLCVFSKMRSLTMPPRKSPSVPPEEHARSRTAPSCST